MYWLNFPQMLSCLPLCVALIKIKVPLKLYAVSHGKYYNIIYHTCKKYNKK